jgi:YD repeat-containing protein
VDKAPSSRWLTTIFSYDHNGNRISLYGDGFLGTEYSFDAHNRLIGYTAYSAGYVAYSILYQYDLAGQRRSATETNAVLGTRNITWTYDDLYRLTGESWTGPSARTVTYDYDAAGNRRNQFVTIGGVTTQTQYSYDGTNQLTQFIVSTNVGSTQYTYDANGNTTSATVNQGGGIVETTYYFYDVAGRLVRAEDNLGATIFSAYYDARTRRLGTTEGGVTTVFRYDGGTSFQELREVNPNPGLKVVAELVRAGGMGGGIGSILYRDRRMSPVMGP